MTGTNGTRRAEELLGWPACDRCGAPVTDPRRAALSIDEAAAWRAKATFDAWRGRKEGEKRRWARLGAWLDGEPDRLQLITWSAQEIATAPGLPPVPWLWAHDRCTPQTQSYEISGERFDSLGKVLDWTLHLAGKDWWSPEAWDEAVRRFWRVPDA